MRSIGKGGAGPPLLGALLVAALVLAAPGALRAQAGPSGKPSPPPPGNCNVNQLVTAIQKANKTPASDTIALTAGCTYTLTAGPYDNGAGPNGLPIVTAPLVIHGNGATITRSTSAEPFRLLPFQDVDAAVDHVVMSNGSAERGGAILTSRSPSLTDSTLAHNSASRSGERSSPRVRSRSCATASPITPPLWERPTTPDSVAEPSGPMVCR